jgi:hypothetical protein
MIYCGINQDALELIGFNLDKVVGTGVRRPGQIKNQFEQHAVLRAG